MMISCWIYKFTLQIIHISKRDLEITSNNITIVYTHIHVYTHMFHIYCIRYITLIIKRGGFELFLMEIIYIAFLVIKGVHIAPRGRLNCQRR